MTVVYAVNLSTTRRRVELSCVAINAPLRSNRVIIPTTDFQVLGKNFFKLHVLVTDCLKVVMFSVSAGFSRASWHIALMHCMLCCSVRRLVGLAEHTASCTASMKEDIDIRRISAICSRSRRHTGTATSGHVSVTPLCCTSCVSACVLLVRVERQL